MRFPRIISALLLAPGFAAETRAWGEEPPPVRVDFAYASKYIFRGVEQTGDSVQAAVILSRENFRGGLWANQPFDQNGVSEANVRAAYVWPAADGPAVEASVMHRWFGNVPAHELDSSLEAGISATWAPVGGFTPGLAWYHDFRFRADTLQASVARSVPLAKWGAFLELGLHAGWTDGDDWRPGSLGPKRRDSHGYWGGEARLPYRVGAYTTVAAGVHYADSFGRSMANGPFGRSAGGNWWVTLGVNRDF
jgi:hypothetical protein